MVLIIIYDQNTKSFSAKGRDARRGGIALDPKIDANDFFWLDCKYMFGYYATVNHIISHEVIMSLIINFANKYINGIARLDEYKAYMTALINALGSSRYSPNNLYTNIQSFYNGGNININLVNDVKISLHNVINSCAALETNMRYGYPKTNVLIDRRLDFPISEFDCTRLSATTLVRDSLSGAPYATSSPIQVAHVKGDSYVKLSNLLSVPFSTGDLSVILTVLPSKNGQLYLNVVCSRNNRIEVGIIEGYKNMSSAPSTSYFAHLMPDGTWLLFDRADMDNYTIYTARP